MIVVSKFAKTNIMISIFLLVIAFLYPYFNENIIYLNKSKEATSVSEVINKIQNINYVNSNKYISIKKGDVINFIKNFSLNRNDIQYYNYSIFTRHDSYTLYAEPKIKYLKARDISPKIYVYYKKLNKTPIIKWQ